LQEGRLVAAGNRNRALRIFDITRPQPENSYVIDKMDAHEVCILNVVFGVFIIEFILLYSSVSLMGFLSQNDFWPTKILATYSQSLSC